MYIETRYHDNGNAEARLTKHRPVTDPDDNTGKYDYYVEVIGEGAADYESIEEWADALEIELDDIIPLVLALDAGEWVDISSYA